MKKTLIFLIIIAYFNTYIACSSTKHTTYSEAELTTNNERDIDVVTKESEKYRFKRNTYQTIGDSLVGKGRVIIGDEEQKLERINIALRDIAYVYNEEQGSTWEYVVVGVVVVGIVVLAITTSDPDEPGKTAHIY